MSFGYTGKILRVNLTRKSVGILDTGQYSMWGGGHGIGSAVFWDLCEDKTVSGFDPKNVVTIMTSPLSGTLSPSSSRCEVQGIGPQGYPVEWFTRSNFGGRFSAQLKYAGWDGIVIEGRAETPVWVNIINDQVRIEDARGLWGMSTGETQEEIWRRVTGERFHDWQEVGGAYTTQRPAVVCIGKAGENISRIAVLLHDRGNAAGQGGFGGVFGAKNLKAISVIGTGGVAIANPNDLMEACLWHCANFQFNVDAPRHESPRPNLPAYFVCNHSPGGATYLRVTESSRPHACQACPVACNRRSSLGVGNESFCMPTMWPFYTLLSTDESREMAGNGNVPDAVPSKTARLNRDRYRVSDLLQHYGLNAFELLSGDIYLMGLFGAGVAGPGKAIDCSLPFDKWDSAAFKEPYIRMIAIRDGIGDDLAEGVARASVRWGRYRQDTESGLLNHPNWGYFEHYDPRVEVEWSYGSILGDRDINEHGGINWAVHQMPLMAQAAKIEPIVPAEKVVQILASKVLPYEGDPFMFDYSEGPTGIYSANRAKTIAWHRHYTRFWTQSIGHCDFLWPNFINTNAGDMLGATPEGEPRFLSAVIGKDLSFVEGMETGRRIWNLDRAIWILQGRHRDMEKFSKYVYTKPVERPHPLPVYENGQWKFSDNLGRTLDPDRFEQWKSRYFRLEGWDVSSGWPTRDTLEEMGLRKIADVLDHHNRLGSPP